MSDQFKTLKALVQALYAQHAGRAASVQAIESIPLPQPLQQLLPTDMSSLATPPRHGNDTATLYTTNTSLESNHQTHVETVVPELNTNNDTTQNPVSLNTPTLSLCHQFLNNLQQVILTLEKITVEELQGETVRMAKEINSLKSGTDSKTTQEYLSLQRSKHVQPETSRSSTTQKDRLVGLVVKASASRAEGPGFESRLRRDFFGVESYQ